MWEGRYERYHGNSNNPSGSDSDGLGCLAVIIVLLGVGGLINKGCSESKPPTEKPQSEVVEKADRSSKALLGNRF